MTTQTRMVYATRGGSPSRIHVPRRRIPIVVVPGFMGTRLADPHDDHDPEGKLAFNPTGKPFGNSPRAMKVDYKRLLAPGELRPADRFHYKKASERRSVAHIRHYHHLVTDPYGALLKRLASLGTSTSFTQLGITPCVYAAGYDWRQDNARSALRLAAVVEEALEGTGANKCILVAHSMGGHVARYYCRALGGEARVHQLYLLGSPTLGAPGAFVQLKHGVNGAYLHDLLEGAVQEDVGKVVREGIGLASQIVKGAFSGDFIESMGPMYLSLCLGAGKLLRRHETVSFARQMASIYQLMPNRVFCDKHKHWVFFDPLLTGQPPTGHMVVMPGVLEATMLGHADVMQAIEGKASTVGEDTRKAYEDALASGRSERTSPRAHRNVTTIDHLVDDFIQGHARLEHEDFSKVPDAGMAVYEMYEHLKHTFVDCRSPRHLYGDIYTGLMDIVSQRPMVASRLALAERFDRALSVGPDRNKEHALNVMMSLLGPIFSAFGGGSNRTPANQHGNGGHGGGNGHGHGGHAPKVYMHPRTTNVFANHMQVEAGCMLLPTDTVSNDDSNEVHHEMIPFPVGLLGDGTVPADSAQPPPEAMSHPFEHTHKATTTHGSLPSDASVHAYLDRRINLGLEDWLQGEA